MQHLKVSDYMQAKPIAVKCGTPLSGVVEILLKYHLTGAPVVDGNNQVVGFVSEQDCLAPLLQSSYYCEGEQVVDEVMFKEVLTVTPGSSIVDLAKAMEGNKPKIYPVVEAGKLLGSISRQQVLRALMENGQLCRTA